MVRQEVNPNQESIRASNFGGVNKITNPLNAQITDAAVLYNIDTDLSGALTKRLGTRSLIDVDGLDTIFSYTINTNFDISITVVITANEVNFYWINNDTGNLVRTFTDVFKSTSDLRPYFLSIPGDVARLLILNGSEAPVQFQFHEYSVVPNAGSTYIFSGDSPKDATYLINDASVDQDTIIFIDGVYDSGATAVYSLGNLTITPSSAFTGVETLTILYITWQWWAEAEIWEGSNFYTQVPRFSVNDADRLVAVPQSIYSDRFTNDVPYGVFTFYNNTQTFDTSVNDLSDLAYTLDSTPTTKDEYYFSNGLISSAYSSQYEIVPSPFAIVFGEVDFPVEFNYAYLDVDTDSNVIHIIDHGLEDDDVVSFEFYNTDTAEVSSTLNVFVINATSNSFQVSLTSGGSAIAFNAFSSNAQIGVSSVNTTTGVITTSAAHSFVDGDPVRVNYTTNGSVPSGLSTEVTYYVENLGGTTLALSLTPQINLTRVVPTGGGSNVVIQRHNDVGYRVTKINRDVVNFVRLRKFSFNGGSGVIAANVLRSLDNDWAGSPTQLPLLDYGTTADYHGFVVVTDGDDLTTYDNTNENFYYSFVSGDDSVQTETSLCRVVNVGLSWVGSNALAKIFRLDDSTSHSGGVYPVYGLGYYADYGRGIFPTVAALHQERLFLGGFRNAPNTVVASAIADTKVSGEFYNFFQITDNLDNTDDDPFDLVLNGDTNALVNGFISWQQLLFIFTEDYVYRSLNVQSPLSPSNRTFILISNTGLVSKYGLAVADTQIFFLSKTGVYDLPIIFENEYRTQEVSLKIRPELDNNLDNQSYLLYHKRLRKLYLACKSISSTNSNTVNSQLWTYNLETSAWTEYHSNELWSTSCGFVYNDHTLGRQAAITTDNSLLNGILKLNDPKLLDYTVTYTAGNTMVANVLRYIGLFDSTTQVSITSDTIRWSPFNDVNDIRVYYENNSSGVSLALPGINYIKVDDRTLLFIDDFFASRKLPTATVWIYPRPEHSFYGNAFYIDDAQYRYDEDGNQTFGSFSHGTLTYNFSSSSYSASNLDSLDYFIRTNSSTATSVAHVGQVYLSYYESIDINLEVLYLTKQFKEAILYFELNSSKLNPNDLGTVGKSAAAILKNLQYITDCNYSFRFDNDCAGDISVDIFSDINNEIDQLETISIIREMFPQNVNNFRVVVWNYTNAWFKLIGYQVNLDTARGTGYISGLR